LPSAENANRKKETHKAGALNTLKNCFGNSTTGLVAVLDRPKSITVSDYFEAISKRVERTGLGEFLFYDMAFSGLTQPDPVFPY